MDGVRKVADTGRTIVCTIHQPSLAVFQVFDSLLLLQRGGESVFFGELEGNSAQLIEHLETIDGVAKLESGYNPATWMLEVIGAGLGNDSASMVDFVAIFKVSEAYQRLQVNLNREGVTRPSSTLPTLDYAGKRAATELTQMKFLAKRFMDKYWRTPSYNLTRFVISIGVGVLLAITYAGSEYSSYQGVNSGMGMLYMTTSFLGVISLTSILPLVGEERVVFYRERAAQTYSAFWYFIGSTLAEIPYVFLSTLLFTVVFFPAVGFTGVNSFFAYWLNMSLHVLLQAYIGELLSYALPSIEVAAVIGVLLNSIFCLFMGYNPPAGSLLTAYKWLYRITPQTYTLAALAAIGFANCPDDGNSSAIGCRVMTNLPPTLPTDTTVKEYLEAVFLIKHSEIWMNCSIVLAFIVFVRLLTLLALRFINHQKR
ncbi:hypothetical protein BBJ28_00016970 [Nothophytophthora sp. Chile5]|nr:hypothetical protein BBJ28_00016970 [Nothophytophthora sp. Chile5]